MVHASPEPHVALITAFSHRKTPYTSLLYTPIRGPVFCLELKEDLYNFTPLLDDSKSSNGHYGNPFLFLREKRPAAPPPQGPVTAIKMCHR